MNRIINGFFAVIAAFCAFAFSSCEGKEDIPVEYLEVTASNIAGKWELVSTDGEPTMEGTFFHITFITKDRKYEIEHNKSSVPESSFVDEGTYQISTDENGAYIRGINVVLENWSQKYYVQDLTSDSMKWVGVSNGIVKMYRRLK